MRSLIVNSSAVLILAAGTTIVSAQSIRTPGQIAAAPRVSVSLLEDGATASTSEAVQKTSIAEVSDSHDKFMNRLWIGSMFAAVAATSADAATSWGKREGNGLLASSDGTFGARGLSIKMGLAAAVIVPQIVFRRHKELKGAFAIGNFGEAAIFTGVAVHNLGIPAASH